MLTVADKEGIGIWKVETACQVRQFSFFFRERMNLLVMKQLECVFDFAEQDVGCCELAKFVGSDEIQIGEANETVESPDAPHMSVFATVSELQKLRHELDIPD